MENSHIKERIKDLPITSGVYLFYDKKEPIYIGKAINIRDRVKTHFFQPNYKDDLYINQVKKIDFIETNSEIEALVLEASLIKKYQPKYNSVWRDDKNYFYVAITKGERPIVYITHQPKKVSGIQNTKYKIPNTRFIGPFVEGNSLKITLKFLRRVFPYYTSVKHPDKKCTWCHLDLCPGPHPNLAAYKKNLKKLQLILEGKRSRVLSALEKEMKQFSKEQQFEKALELRNKMQALQQVMAHTNVIQNSKLKIQNSTTNWPETEKVLQKLIKVNMSISKIECYDISNIQGTQAVGSMVVFVNGAPDKSQYKKFRIRRENTPNDIAMLKEVLARRLGHSEWDYPQVMLIDGGIAQLNVGIKAKETIAPHIKIISIAKGKRELLIEGQPEHIPLKNLPQEVYNLIVHLDDEAHRFALSYHRNLRKKNLLT